jgi:hypothetical protein
VGPDKPVKVGVQTQINDGHPTQAANAWVNLCVCVWGGGGVEGDGSI